MTYNMQNYVGPAASNLRQLLYGVNVMQEKLSYSPSGFEEQKSLNFDNNFLSNFDEALEFQFDDEVGSQSVLLKKQDIYIEQLEDENKEFKKQLGTLQVKIQQVIDENNELIQSHKNEILNSLISEPRLLTVPKGLSDEEKMFQGRSEGDVISTSNENKWLEKIKQLENEIVLLRKENRTEAKENLMLNVSSLQRENENLAQKINHLEDAVMKLKIRETEAENKIREGIILVEQVQMEKFQAQVERDAMRESVDKQHFRFETLSKDYERRLEEEKQKLVKINDNHLQDCERDAKTANLNLASLKVNLEKSEREKSDLRQQLQKVSSQLDTFQTEYNQTLQKYQEEVTRCLIERNLAIENSTQLKMANERMKLENEKEIQLLKLELNKYREKIEETDVDFLKTKSELAKLYQQRKVLERQYEFTKTMAAQDKSSTKEDVDEIKKFSKLKEDQLRNFNETTKQKYINRCNELEQMLDKQIELGKKFRQECHLLEEKIQRIVKYHKQTTTDLQRKNEEIIEKLLNANKNGMDLEKDLDKSKLNQIELQRKLNEMENENLNINQQIMHLQNQNKMLLKERQLLESELKFISQKLNAGDIGVKK